MVGIRGVDCERGRVKVIVVGGAGARRNRSTPTTSAVCGLRQRNFGATNNARSVRCFDESPRGVIERAGAGTADHITASVVAERKRAIGEHTQVRKCLAAIVRYGKSRTSGS